MPTHQFCESPQRRRLKRVQVHFDHNYAKARKLLCLTPHPDHSYCRTTDTCSSINTTNLTQMREHKYGRSFTCHIDHSYAKKCKKQDNSGKELVQGNLMQFTESSLHQCPHSTMPPRYLPELNLLHTDKGLFWRQSVAGDGNCFFRALSVEIFGLEDNHTLLRHKIVQLMQCYPQQFCAYTDGDFNQHMEDMQKTNGGINSWATHTEVFASATLFQCPIYMYCAFGQNLVWSKFSPLFTFQSSDAYHPYIMLCNTSGQHYDRIVHYDKKCNCTQNPPTLHNINDSHVLTPQHALPQNCAHDDNRCIKPARLQSKRAARKTSKKVSTCKNSNQKSQKDEGKNTYLNNKIPSGLTQDNRIELKLKHIRKFEATQMNYEMEECTICQELKLKTNRRTTCRGICVRCMKDKDETPMFSAKNNMDPKQVPPELEHLTVAESLLICRISPCMNIYMKNHGGLASSGHCICFPQEINEPAQIFPRLPSEINILKVRKENASTGNHKDFTVRRRKVERALYWLKDNNPAFTDINISTERLLILPENGPINVPTLTINSKSHDLGPAPDQFPKASGDENLFSASGMLLPKPKVGIKAAVQKIVREIVNTESADKVDILNNRPIIPWPTRSTIPVSEKTTIHFFTMAFPTLFHFGSADFFVNRPRSCNSLADWAQHLLWYKDGRFAKHLMFKFIVHNMIQRWRSMQNSKFYINQQLGDPHITVSELKHRLEGGDHSIVDKLLYFGANLRGTSQYWLQRSKDLRALIQYKINEGGGLPSYFVTGSCAEFHFKPLRRILLIYLKKISGKKVTLDNHNSLYTSLQDCAHIVSQYFQLRTEAYFKEVMKPVFNVDTYWYRFEFAKSRGMIHWHGLCWRKDREPYQLLHKCLQAGQSKSDTAEALAKWAETELSLTAMHPAGKTEEGQSKTNLWPPPEGSCPAPSDDCSPLNRLFTDLQPSEQNQDHLHLVNRTMLHRCSDYCLTIPTAKQKTLPSFKKVCRMEFPKIPQNEPCIRTDKNGALRLEMPRDHPNLVQHSKLHIQAWRANCDISVILSKSPPDNPSVNDIIACDRYETGYACKGNESTDSAVHLFNETVRQSSNDDESTAFSLCVKTLNTTIGQRDVSSTEACHELSKLPLYQCSHQFLNVSLKGTRQLEQHGSTLTKATPLDKYLERPEGNTMSWYNFMTKSLGKVPCLSGGSINPTWPLTEDYCRTALLLHTPDWRKIEDIKGEGMSWIDAMKQFSLSQYCPNYILAQIESAKRKMNNNTDSQTEEYLTQNNEIEQPDWVDLLSVNPDIQPVVEDFSFDDGGPDFNWSQQSFSYPTNFKNWLNCQIEESVAKQQNRNRTLNLPQVEYSSMNVDQRFIFNLVVQTLKHFKENSPAYRPLRIIVNGKAGAGKSYLIRCLVKAIRCIFNNNKTVQVITPTGNSANLIGGVTAHSFLKIPTGQKSFQELEPQFGKLGEALQENCSELLALIGDEHSMFGRKMMGHMENSLRVGTPNNPDLPWGGIPVVAMFGDFLQLPPVCDTPVYVKDHRNPAANHGLLVWQQFDTAANLDKPIRQKENEKELRNVIEAVRTYKVSLENGRWLQKFQWNMLIKTHGPELLAKMDKQGVFVFPTHSAEWERNKEKILQLNKSYPIAKIKAENKGTHANISGKTDTKGLPNTLFLCKKAKVQLCCNIYIPYGLFNGAVGEIIDIIYLEGRKPPCLPDVVMVQFRQYTGPPFVKENPLIVPIVPVERNLDCKCFCKRQQIPLRLAFGLTIHRIQGITVGKGEAFRYIVIDPGNNKFESQNPGALHVALSRAKSAGSKEEDPDFAWNPSLLVNMDRLCHKVQTKTTCARSLELTRLTTLANTTRQRFHHLDSEEAFAKTITWINEQQMKDLEE